MMEMFRVQDSGFRVCGIGLRSAAIVSAISLAVIASASHAQDPTTLPTPLPQPFSPNGVLRPIIPYQPAVPMPNQQRPAIIPLPTPAPYLMIAPLKTPGADINAQAQNLIKTVPMHRKWPVLQPRDTPKGAGPSSAMPGAGLGASASVSPTFGVPSIAPHRRPLGW
jgi:hypothetical protein